MNSIPEHPPSPGQFTQIVSSKYTCQEQESFEVQQARWRTAVVHLDLPHDIKWWSAEHVADWLDHIGFRQHSDNFIKNGITGQVLLLLADTSLLKEVVPSVGVRVLILHARDMLLQQQQQQQEQQQQQQQEHFTTRRSSSTQRYRYAYNPPTNHIEAEAEEAAHQQSVPRPQQ